MTADSAVPRSWIIGSVRGFILAAAVVGLSWCLMVIRIDLPDLYAPWWIGPLSIILPPMFFGGPVVVGFWCGGWSNWAAVVGAIAGQAAGAVVGGSLGDGLAKAIAPQSVTSGEATTGFIGLAVLVELVMMNPLLIAAGAIAGWLLRRLRQRGSSGASG